MKRLKQMLRRKAGEVAPEPAGSSVRLAREESGPSVPAGGEEACGQANRRSSLNCWRKRKPPAPLAGPEAPPGPKWRWPRVMLCRRDPGEGGSRARWLCGFLYRKQRSQEPSPRAQQEPSTSLATEEPPAGPEQELGDSGTGARSSTYSRGASSPSVGSDSPEAEGSLFAETPSAQLEEAEEEEDVFPEQDTMRIIQWHLQGRAELVEDLAKQLRFLHAVPRLCFLAQQQGRDTLEPHFSKAALVESIAELIENLPMLPEPTSIISSSMAAVCSLSKLKPPLALELESRLLRALLYTIFTMGTGQDATHFRALHNTYLQGLDTMLGCLLTETPTTDKLQHLLEHVHFWHQSKNTQERARAIRSSAALLQFATSLPGFDTSSDFPKAGNFVLQLGLYISDPANDISQQARSGIHWLQRLLLQRRGLNIQEASDLWCRDGLQDTERLAYSNMARVGEVFGRIFSEGQRRSFLQAALLAIHDPQIRVSRAGLVLTYSILGEAGQLIGDEQEDVTATIMAHLFYIRCLRQVPKALQGLCAVEHL